MELIEIGFPTRLAGESKGNDDYNVLDLRIKIGAVQVRKENLNVRQGLPGKSLNRMRTLRKVYVCG